uniref:Uncharacterized protein n=1 Tax=Brassica oleracea var. oleracea TaxID=109376 RepID=A0A0D3B1Z3_BRAOL
MEVWKKDLSSTLLRQRRDRASGEELEGLADPMRKEVDLARKEIDSVNKLLKPLATLFEGINSKGLLRCFWDDVTLATQ